MAMTLRYEADVDLPTLAAELGVEAGGLAGEADARRRAWRATSAALKVAGRHGVAAGGGAGVRRPGRASCGWARPSSRARPARACRTTPARSTRWRRSRARPTRWRSSPDGRCAAFASADRSVAHLRRRGRPRPAPLHRPHRVGVVRRLLARRHPAALRRQGRHRPPVGRGHGRELKSRSTPTSTSCPRWRSAPTAGGPCRRGTTTR